MELRQLRQTSPDLALAIDLQIAVLETQRLAQSRVSLPRVHQREDLLTARLRNGERLIEFDDIVFDWSDARRLVRDAADLLQRYELIERDDAAYMTALVRETAALPVCLRGWYDRVAAGPQRAQEIELNAGRGQVCLIAMRPYLVRCAAAVQTLVDGSAAVAVCCPVCGGDPDFTVWSARGRQLVCGRCTARWAYPEACCAYCGDTDPRARKSFASQSRTYRVEACESCRRYLKGFDERRSTRPMILSVDTIATLPLDAAAMQLGFE